MSSCRSETCCRRVLSCLKRCSRPGENRQQWVIEGRLSWWRKSGLRWYLPATEVVVPDDLKRPEKRGCRASAPPDASARPGGSFETRFLQASPRRSPGSWPTNRIGCQDSTATETVSWRERKSCLLPQLLVRGPPMSASLGTKEMRAEPRSERHFSTSAEDSSAVEQRAALPNYSTEADITLQKFYDAIEGANLELVSELECSDGVLQITVENAGTFVLNKHYVTKQLWYSSPLSGPDYFDFDPCDGFTQRWISARSGKSVAEKLGGELSRAVGKVVTL